MELDKFISETLKKIIDGINEAQKYAETKGAKITGENIHLNPRSKGNITTYFDDKGHELIENISFDIAVTTKESGLAEGKVGIFVGQLGIGTKGQIENESNSINRIQFSVPLYLPKETKE